ncbi:hypothetical protein DXG01_005189 [Tephrocybe rancida]|nr:hypothetical protein DXG01_005189 [Tephrocybe rancida]
MVQMLFTTLVALSPIVAALGAGQVVDLGYAKYEGTLNATTGNTRFFGIRYAAPPTGYGRWQLPKRPDAVGGIIQANVQPPACPSAGLGTSPTTPFHLAAVSADAFSEDCLFLNVFTPQMPAVGVKAKPVVVWIHGGGYQLGSALGFNGEDTIREAHGGVVAVMIQYRLGVYGFLPGNEVKSGGVLNAGLLDQEFALKWVQKHVSKFGGDPSQVTIWGESADTLACLRAVDTVALQVINNNISDSAFFGTAVFVPVVDGTFITQSPTKALKERKVNGEALLAVTNTLEGFIFVDPKLAVSTSEYVRQLFPKFGAREVAKTASQYANIGNTPVDRAISIMGEGHSNALAVLMSPLID